MESQHSDVLDANGNVTSKQDDAPSHKLDTVTDMNLQNKPFEILRNLENASYIYRQDVVRRKSNSEIGIVTQVHGDSDSDSSISEAENEDEDEDEDGDGNEIDDVIGPNHGNNNKEINGNSGENARANSDENESAPNILTADHVRVLLLDGSEIIESVSNVNVVDRGLLHGDYVAAASDPTGQVGIVVDVNIDVDLLSHDGSVLKDKSSRDLKRIKNFTVGDYVVLGPWLGRVDDVFDNVTVQLDDGSVCKVMRADPFHLIPIRNNINEDGHFPYYPGQRVKASSSSVFKNSRWLSGLWKANRLEGTVTKVTVGSLWIYWIASAGYGPDSAITPSEEQSPKNLKLLSCFAHTNWQFGYWCLLPPSELYASLNEELVKQDSSHSAMDEPESTETGDESDPELATMDEQTGHTKIIGKSSETCIKNGETSNNSASIEILRNTSGQPAKGVVREIGPFHRKKIRKVAARKDKKCRKKLEDFERALQIISIKTKVDVVWQDGKIERGLASASLIPIESPGDHEFVTEQYVVEKAADNDDAVGIKRVGVVRSVNANDRTACVRWLKPVSKADDPKEFDKEEVVSVYELEGHPDYDYCYGDVVVRLSPVLLPAKMSSFEPSAENAPLSSSGDPEHEESKLHVLDNTNYSPANEFSDLSWVGNITGLRDGDIEITWADGMISTVGPQAIYVVGRDDDESMATGSDASDDTASWETVEDDKNSVDEEANRMDYDGDTIPEIEDSNIVSEHSGKNRALAIPMAAIGFMTRLASGIFSRGRNHLDPLNIGIKNVDDFHPDEMPLHRSPDVDVCSENPTDIESKFSKLTTACVGEGRDLCQSSDILEVAEALCNLKPLESLASSRKDSVLKFKDFDIARDPSDHHFVSSYGQNNASRKWLKKVQQDWDILQKNLPGDIYGRAYEDRMDLLRAVIVGAYGTPYQDGLFFFDFHLPPEYPDVPPSAYYHSGGWRINPNLYEEGKVCLSLLNTWTGRGNEVWDPSTSSILQVLVSLQGLVLNSKPYFNEAGYDKQVGTAEGEKNSLSYNENTFLLNCKTMMYLMRKPPKNFEELIIEHFRKRGPCILKACDAYMKGHLIGSLTKNVCINDSSNTNANSVGFKLMLAKLVPKLFSSLSKVGANCQEFEHLATGQL